MNKAGHSEMALPIEYTEAAQLAGPNHSHTEQDKSTLLRQLRLNHSHTEQDRALY